MNKITFTITLALISFHSFAQNPGWKELENKPIGWDKAMSPNGDLASKSSLFGYMYPKKSIAFMDSLNNWIRKSYSPVGGLPQLAKTGIPEKNYYYPKATGVRMQMWAPAYDATGKKIVKAQPAHNSAIWMLGNYLPGIEPAHDFNTASQFYFTLPYTMDGEWTDKKIQLELKPYIKDLKNKTGDYLITFYRGAPQIILIPGNRLPLVAVTRREFFEKAEQIIRQTGQDKRAGKQEMMQDQLNYLFALKEKYKKRMDETVSLKHKQLSASTFYTNKDNDIFLPKGDEPLYPLYRFEPSVYETAKQGNPQWLTISFPFANEKSKTVDREIWKAMTENFNFQYVYDYLFNPQKAKDKSYKARN